ncbi:MAG: hypothetical protein ABIK28_02280 [Planctomycetota bacterium]
MNAECASGSKAAPKPVQTRRRSLALKILLSLATLLIASAFVEALLCALNIYPPIPNTYVGEYEFRESVNFMPDDRIGWRMRPDREFAWMIGDRNFHFASNHDGFRNDPPKEEGRKDLKRIVVVGDSFMWGYGVECEERCDLLLASWLKDCVVYNYAMPCFGVDQIWLALQEWGFRQKPDLVIVGLYTSDFSRIFDACQLPERITRPIFKLEDNELIQQTADDQPGWLLKKLEENSRFYCLFRRLNRKMGFLFGIGSWWDLNRKLLDSMHEACAEAGVPVLFLHFPYLDGRVFPALNAYMEKNDLHYIDFVEKWGGPRRDLYIVEDPHLNAAGHRDVAESLFDWVRHELKWETIR